MKLAGLIWFLYSGIWVERHALLGSLRNTVIISMVLFSCNQCHAQLMTASNVQVTILSGTQITVKGDILINNGTTINNTGTIDLTGNWVNNSSATVFGNSKGTVVMNGLNQQINGTFSTTFFNLNLFNGTKTMNTDITTGGMVSSALCSLNCNNAILDLNSHTAIIHNINPAGITATTGYILSEDADNSSKVWWEFVGQGLHTIPFGNISGAPIPFSFWPLPATGSLHAGISNGTFVGYGADASLNGFFNVTAIGSGAIALANNQVKLGNTLVTTIGGAVNWSVISDARFKKDIRNDVAGLDFIVQLKPVTYHYDILKYRNHIGESKADTTITVNMVQRKEAIRYSGFLAQEVESAAILSGYDFSGVHHPENETDTYTLSYAEFVVPLVKAIQELNSKLEAINKENSELRSNLLRLQTKIYEIDTNAKMTVK